jgi:hypothetical protein
MANVWQTGKQAGSGLCDPERRGLGEKGSGSQTSNERHTFRTLAQLGPTGSQHGAELA